MPPVFVLADARGDLSERLLAELPHPVRVIADADAVHENVAAVDLAGELARQQPALTGDILAGALRALLDAAWRHGPLLNPMCRRATPWGAEVEP